MELKPCPFCGSDMQNYTVSFKRDKRKFMGVYHQICTIKCDRCTCSIRQAGTTDEIAERYAIEVWNRRMNDDLR